MTPIYLATCPAGTSIYTVDYQGLKLGFLPGGFYVFNDLTSNGIDNLTVNTRKSNNLDGT